MSKNQNAAHFNMEHLSAVGEMRAALREQRIKDVLANAGMKIKQESLNATAEISKQVGALNFYSLIDNEAIELLCEHSKLTAINAAYTSAVERLMLGVFGSTIENAQEDQIPTVDLPANSLEWLEQLGQLAWLYQKACSQRTSELNSIILRQEAQ